jgi:hypothetical protein
MSRSLTKVVAFAFVLTFTFGVARTSFAQDADNNIIHPIDKQGSTAMIFELAGIGTFGFSGPGISGFTMPAVGGKYFISDGMALFVLAGFNSSSGGGDTISSTQSAKPSSTDFGIAAGIQIHCRPLYSTSPYWGGMISFGSHSDDNGEPGGNSDNPPDVKHSTSTFGVAALGGFDWFFTHGLALGGEVSLGFRSSSGSTTVNGSTSTTTDGQGTTVISLATNASVHLNVFF